MKQKITIFSMLLGLFLVVGCKKGPGEDEQPLEKKNRTVIAYIMADNNLYGGAVGNSTFDGSINQMEQAWTDSFDGYMVVYLYPRAYSASLGIDYDERPRLLLIEHDQTSEIKSRALKYYDRTQDPCDPEVLKQVVNDTKELAPADNYGLVMWSHGSGWLPGGKPLENVTSSNLLYRSEAGIWSKLVGWIDEAEALTGMVGYSFGEGGYTYGTAMEINEMAAVLSQTGLIFDFILFDACHMASIEVAYQLKDRANYLIASAAEIWSYSFPYDKIVPLMMETRADVEQIGVEYYEYYANQSSASLQDATIVVVDNAKLTNLAAQVKLLAQSPLTGTFTAAQQYGRGSYRNTFYDLTDLVTTAWGVNNMTEYQEAVEAAVVYKAATPSFFGIQNVTYSGFSCYIPSTTSPTALGIYKQKFEWSTASGFENLVQ